MDSWGDFLTFSQGHLQQTLLCNLIQSMYSYLHFGYECAVYSCPYFLSLLKLESISVKNLKQLEYLGDSKLRNVHEVFLLLVLYYYDVTFASL